MYDDTVTLFNRLHKREGDLWFPTVLCDVDYNGDRAAVVARYGSQSQDKAMLHVKCRQTDDGILVGGKLWLPPKEWAAQEETALAGSLTFEAGEYFDFFLLGEWPDETAISDNAYRDGFFNHINRQRDFVFTVTSAARYSMIPHFEITGK